MGYVVLHLDKSPDNEVPMTAHIARTKMPPNAIPELTYLNEELVDQDEAAFIAAFHHDFHVGQVRRISTQVIFDGLFVTDIDEDTAEHTCMTAFVQRNQHTALQHILQQTDCF